MRIRSKHLLNAVEDLISIYRRSIDLPTGANAVTEAIVANTRRAVANIVD